MQQQPLPGYDRSARVVRVDSRGIYAHMERKRIVNLARYGRVQLSATTDPQLYGGASYSDARQPLPSRARLGFLTHTHTHECAHNAQPHSNTYTDLHTGWERSAAGSVGPSVRRVRAP